MFAVDAAEFVVEMVATVVEVVVVLEFVGIAAVEAAADVDTAILAAVKIVDESFVVVDVVFAALVIAVRELVVRKVFDRLAVCLVFFVLEAVALVVVAREVSVPGFAVHEVYAPVIVTDRIVDDVEELEQLEQLEAEDLDAVDVDTFLMLIPELDNRMQKTKIII